ncbi:hypothetical protein Cob_v004538 [Colletotrichum orbiculare MAFF 240422]|uniref:Uncharacterized protein n=1 Tax=Colletotrichum orbiculare (strain 104-T / ATCC 96160 / CBS 514.97 / LARS 414 / MAFF 240422) TaxID=1213857 RepID=A0A484FX06_COLOR|nr:hypothetical protein Cob_v004538 [Colletotrichum orbiculare MAFF 240422]
MPGVDQAGSVIFAPVFDETVGENHLSVNIAQGTACLLKERRGRCCVRSSYAVLKVPVSVSPATRAHSDPAPTYKPKRQVDSCRGRRRNPTNQSHRMFGFALARRSQGPQARQSPVSIKLTRAAERRFGA